MVRKRKLITFESHGEIAYGFMFYDIINHHKKYIQEEL